MPACNKPRSQIRAAILACILLSAALRALAQQPSSPYEDPKDELAAEIALYSSAKPYLDAPNSQLKKSIPELAGLAPTAQQFDLKSLLANAGRRAARLLQDMPDLIATEKVSRSAYQYGTVSSQTEKYNYLILAHKESSDIKIEEYRADQNNQRIGSDGSDPRAPNSQGFALAWINFYPANQSQSRFRYLGTQKVHGHQCFVVAFAEIPGRVPNPGLVYIRRVPILVLYQGIAWIAQDEYSIVQLREDLLAPHPELGISQLTTEVEFGEERLASPLGSMWLPRSAYIRFQAVNASGMELAPSVERHLYSNYRRYQVEVKINPKSY